MYAIAGVAIPFALLFLLATCALPESAAAVETVVTGEYETKSMGFFRLSAYCPCEHCCGKAPSDPDYGITKSGVPAIQGKTIAVDPRVIPLGTEVIIGGHTYTAEDIGGAITENCVDIYFDSHEDALDFGIQYNQVYIKIKGDF